MGSLFFVTFSSSLPTTIEIPIDYNWQLRDSRYTSVLSMHRARISRGSVFPDSTVPEVSVVPGFVHFPEFDYPGTSSTRVIHSFSLVDNPYTWNSERTESREKIENTKFGIYLLLTRLNEWLSLAFIVTRDTNYNSEIISSELIVFEQVSWAGEEIFSIVRSLFSWDSVRKIGSNDLQNDKCS